VEQENKKIQVAVVAQQFLTRLGIKTILSVIGIEPEVLESNNFYDLKNVLASQNFDFMILSEDILPLPKNISLNELTRLSKNTRLMVISDKKIENCPCSNFVLYSDNQKEVLDKFQEFFFEPEDNSQADGNENVLSEREIDILREVASGFSNKKIADKLHISINTVITHRKNITEKLGIKTIAGLTVYALINNIIDAENLKNL